MPNGVAQQAVVRKALASAGVTPDQIDYVEAHGTGTPLGDPIEVEALAAVLGAGRPASRPLQIGSIKTNIGHAESASGVAGLLKVVLALQHEEIPAHLHLEALNQRIAWDGITVPTRRTPWPGRGRSRLAGVSSFGFTGTNAHLIVREAPERSLEAGTVERPLHLLTLSAASGAALGQLAERYAGHLGSSDASLADICFTANTGRAHLPHRAALVAASREQARAQLAALAAGRSEPGLVTGVVSTDAPKVAFLLTGQGSQYRGMGRDLYHTQPVFRRALDRCAALLDGTLGDPLLALLHDDAIPAEALNETANTQPAIFAIEYALCELWRSWGIEPSAVLGHSIGEFAAACTAGAVTVQDALGLVAARGRLMQELPERGAMVAVFAEEARVAAAIAAYGARVSIAAVNGPTSIVISGATDALETVRAALAADGVRCEPLRVSHAFHSPLMAPMLDAFERVAREVRLSPPRIGLVSNVTGTWVRHGELDGAYWRRHVVSPVRFAASMQCLHDQGYRVFVEVGPTPTLTAMGRRCLTGADVKWAGSLTRDRADWSSMLESLAALYASGVRVDWAGFDREYPRHRVVLPTYPFQRQRYWVAPSSPRRRTERAGEAGPESLGHPLLGTCISPAESRGVHVWQNEISTERFPYLADHCVQDMPVLPATAYAEMGMAAAMSVLGEGPFVLTQLDFRKPLFLPRGFAADVQVVLKEQDDGAFSLRVFSRPAMTDASSQVWTLNMTGVVARGGPSEADHAADLTAARARCSVEVSGVEFYQRFAQKGNDWGPAFQGTRRLLCGDGEALGDVVVPQSVAGEMARYVFHPAVSDACGHVLAATLPMDGEPGKGGAFVGGGIAEMRLYRRPSGARLTSWARLRRDVAASGNELIGDVAVFDESGAIVGETLGARLFYLDAAEPARETASIDEWLYDLGWERQERGEEPRDVAPGAGGQWLILADASGVGDAVARALQARGEQAVLARAGDRWERTAERAFRLRPASRDDLGRLLDEAFGRGRACRGILHLWSLDAAAESALSVAALERAQALGCGTALALVQELLERRWPAPPVSWFVTRGAVRVGAEGWCAFAQAPLWGFARSLAAEAGAVWGGLVDLDPVATPDEAAASLVPEVLEPDRDDQIVYREGERLVARLRRLTPAAGVSLRWRTEAAYLITGGLGGLALEVARWMAGQGARRLILLGRTPLPPRSQWRDAAAGGGRTAARIAAVRELEAMGATVELVALDVADGPGLAAFLDAWRREERPPIRGVVHTAGVMRYEPLGEHTWEAMAAVMHPKVVGGWVLHQLFCDQPLDFFVLFSSASSILSSPLIGSYAGANSFLDALAHHRAAQGQPALAVNWGLWAAVGMAASFASEHGRASQHGPAMIAPRDGVDALDRLMKARVTQAMVTPVRWDEWSALYPAFVDAPLLRELTAAPAASRVRGSSTSRSLTREALFNANDEERERLLLAYATGHIASVLGLGPEQVDVHHPITAMGLDSLMAVELKNRFEADLEVTVPIVRLLKGPSVSDVSALLLVAMEAEPLAAPSDPGAEAALAAVGGAVTERMEEGEI